MGRFDSIRGKNTARKLSPCLSVLIELFLVFPHEKENGTNEYEDQYPLHLAHTCPFCQFPIGTGKLYQKADERIAANISKWYNLPTGIFTFSYGIEQLE